MVLIKVVKAKFLPRNSRPIKNIKMLNSKIKTDNGKPVISWIKIPIPVVPPVIKPEGIIKKAMPMAYRKLPHRMMSRFFIKCMDFIGYPFLCYCD